MHFHVIATFVGLQQPKILTLGIIHTVPGGPRPELALWSENAEKPPTSSTLYL